MPQLSLHHRHIHQRPKSGLKLSCVPCFRMIMLAVAGFPVALLGGLVGHSRVHAQSGDTPTGSPNNFSGPLKIVQLLWKGNPSNAANALTRSIAIAIDRGELETLARSLERLRGPAEQVVQAGDATDPRFAPALAVALLTDTESDLSSSLIAAFPQIVDLEQRQILWRLWLRDDLPKAQEFFIRQLTDSQRLTESSNVDADTGNASAAQGDAWLNSLIASTLESHRDWGTRAVLDHWQNLSPGVQVAAIEPLTASADSMALLLSAIEGQVVSKDLLNTNQLRKWLAQEDRQLIDRIEAIWGQVRLQDDQERQMLVAQTLERIAEGARGSVGNGVLVFERVCSQCHQLHGRGFAVGPNIAGNGRGNLQQLVSNILDPSLVIGDAFQAKTVLTVDGQVVSGLVAAENERYLKLKIQGGQLVEFDKEDIEQLKVSKQSLMPVGIEGQLQPQELLDLLAYLCLLLPPDSPSNELIPGTPAQFVQP